MAKPGFGQRLTLAWQALTGAYAGASKGRRSLTGWVTRSGDADADTLWDLPTLRERSRDAIRNIPIAAGAIHTKVVNVVGTGLKVNPQIDFEILGMTEDQAEAWENQAEREFNAWACSEECDIERTLVFAEQQELAFRSTLENGDCFAVLPFIERPGSDYGLKIQLIEADRVSNPGWGMDTETLAGGVEKDTWGAPVAYHISRIHPGFHGNRPFEWDRYPAFGQTTGRRLVLHLYHKLRIGQTRGVPDLAPVMEPLKQLGRYTEAEIDAAVVSSFLTVFTKTEGAQGMAPMTPRSETGAKASDDDFKLAPGAILDLMPGESIDTLTPGRPNTAFDPFVMAVLRQIGVALELPFEILVKHFTSSYSAARAALEDAKRFFRGRRVWLAANFCQPVYEALIWEAVSRGRLAAPGFLTDPAIRRAYLGDYRNQWVGPGFAQIDPVKENQADEIAEDRGWKTANEITAEKTGGDWTRKARKRAKEIVIKREAGMATEAEPAQTGRTEDEEEE